MLYSIKFLFFSPLTALVDFEQQKNFNMDWFTPDFSLYGSGLRVKSRYLPEKGGQRKQGFQASGCIQTLPCTALLSFVQTSKREDCTGKEYIYNLCKANFHTTAKFLCK